MNGLKDHALSGLLAGTARKPLDVSALGLAAGDKGALQALSLAGQALRFERPAMPASFVVETAATDSRRIVPEALRRPFFRLLATKPGMAGNLFSTALAQTLDGLKLRPHPFDLPRMETFVRSHAQQLGAAAVAFAQKDTQPDQRRGYFDADALDDGNWTLATAAQMARFAEQRRRQDAGAGRTLIESVWAGENADVRVRLLGALREGLRQDDIPFLQGLLKDRAPRVRELAQRLLARLPGAQGDNPALKAVLERIKKGQTGLLKKRPVLSLELPATVKQPGAAVWITETFATVGLEEMARGLSLTVMDMIAAAEKDDNLLLAFVLMATQDKDFEALTRIVDQHMPDAWEQLGRTPFNDIGFLSPDERALWAATLVRPQTWVGDVPVWGLMRLYQMLEGPAPEALMRDIFKARPWLSLLKDDTKISSDLVDVLSVLCPAAMRPALRAQIAGIEAPKTTNALLYLDIADALEALDV